MTQRLGKVQSSDISVTVNPLPRWQEGNVRIVLFQGLYNPSRVFPVKSVQSGLSQKTLAAPLDTIIVTSAAELRQIHIEVYICAFSDS